MTLKVPQQRKYIPMRNIILRTLAATGVIGIALIAPKMLRFVHKLDRAKTRRTMLYQRIAQAIASLERAGLVATNGERGRRSVRLTTKGKVAIDSLFMSEYTIPEPAFWDGRWRILTFDMKESRRRARDTLRMLLRNTGFVRLQDSVWVYPYACDEFVELIRAHLSSGTGELQYFVAEALESDKPLRQHFNLLS